MSCYFEGLIHRIKLRATLHKIFWGLHAGNNKCGPVQSSSQIYIILHSTTNNIPTEVNLWGACVTRVLVHADGYTGKLAAV